MATVITTVTQLQAMENDLTADYELGGNIDASATSGWNGGLGFASIGSFASPFTGSFDGKGFKITDLTIARPTESWIGLFSYTTGGAITDIGLESCSISGKQFVGALVGGGDGVTFTDCWSTGTVDSIKGSVGGLFGYSYEDVEDCYSSCTITSTGGANDVSECGGLIGTALRAVTRCYSIGSVTATSDGDIGNVGGLVGYGGGSAEIILKCYATGDVSVTAGEDADYIGGFTGNYSGNYEVSDCYSRGDVTVVAGVPANSGDIGGFIGIVSDADSIIDDCYSTGLLTVTADVPDVGGFCGDNYGTVTNCFWDTTTSGTATSDGGTGKTTAQMKTEATFTDAGWDFTTIWGINAVQNNGYPILSALPDTAPTVTTQAVSSIAATTATGNGNITDLGSPNPTAHGVCYNTTGSPTVADDTTDEGVAGATGAFTSSMTGLSINTLYYVKAYAANTAGISYGSEVTFTTLGVPTVTTQTCESVVGATATGRGTITVLGNPAPTAHGHCWNTTTNPTTSNSFVDNGAASATGTFTSAITGLTPGTGYYTRAYATNTQGTVYGANVYFVASTSRAGYTWDEASNLRSFDQNAIERQYIHTDDVDDTPANGATTDPISSNWAFDHVAAADPHTGYVLESLFDAQTVLQATSDDTPTALTVTEQTVVGRLTGGNISAVSLGIADNNVAQIDGTTNAPANLDYAKFTTSGLEGRSYSEVLSDLSAQATAAFSMNSQKITSLLTPTVSTDAVTKEYVDIAVANLRWDYYFNDTASGVGAYYEMAQESTGEPESTFTIPSSIGVGDDQLIFSWISDVVVTFDTIEAGVIDVHLHAQRTVGNRDIVLYTEIYEYTSTPTEVLIATTETSAAITDSKASVSFHATLSTDYEIAATSKLLIKVYANVSGGGQNVIIALYAEGTNASRVSVPVPSLAFDDVYVRLSTFDANTILAANSNDTPVAVAIAEQRIVGRITSGNITALTAAQVATLVEGSIDHGSLAGLGDVADHDYALLHNGTRALSGAWDMGSQNLTNVNIDSGTVDGVTITAPVLDGTVTNTGAALILPAFTLGGTMDANSQALINVLDLDLGTESTTGTFWATLTAANAGTAWLIKSRDTSDIHRARLGLSGGVDTAVWAWVNSTHTGIVLSGALDANSNAITNHAQAITDNAILTVDHITPVSGDYAKFTANGLEGREKSEVLGDLNVADGADVTGSNTCDTPGGASTDTTAIHDDTANEITAITLKGTPAAADEVVLEDSAASYVKKSATIATLGAGIKLDDFATPDDNTDLNATITYHGLLKKLDNTATNYMDGTGVWSVPAGVGGAALTVAETQVFSGTSPATMTDLDLSGTVGANATLVLLKFSDTLGSRRFAVRKNGDTDEFYDTVTTAKGAALAEQTSNAIHIVLVATTDDAGIIEWRSDVASAGVTVDIIAYIV